MSNRMRNIHSYKVKVNFIKKLHDITFSLRPEEAVLLDSQNLSAKNNLFCYLRNELAQYYTTEKEV